MVINRQTPQRMMILQYLRSVRTHPSAETVYSAIKKKMPTITLATVYRNLNLLAEQGIIDRLEINKEYRYDGQPDTHLHGLCRKCGMIIDIYDEKVEKDLLRKAKKLGFKAERANVLFDGICAKCD